MRPTLDRPDDPRIPECPECGDVMVKSWLDDVYECERCVQIKLTSKESHEAFRMERENTTARKNPRRIA